MSDIQFAEGLFFREPPQNAPDYVVGSISVKPGQFIRWLETQKENDAGYVNLAVKRSKGGKIYIALDDWKPGRKSTKDLDDNPF